MYWCLYYTRKEGVHITDWGPQMAGDDIFKFALSWKNVSILIKILLKLVSRGPIPYHKSTLVQVMAWCQTGDKPLHEPMMMWFTGAYIYFQSSVSVSGRNFLWGKDFIHNENFYIKIWDSYSHWFWSLVYYWNSCEARINFLTPGSSVNNLIWMIWLNHYALLELIS